MWPQLLDVFPEQKPIEGLEQDFLGGEATVEPAKETPELVSINNGMSEGMGLLVVVTGDSSSVAAAQLRASSGQDETLVVVCATHYTASNRFVVDATSTESMIASWSVLIVGANQAVPT